MQADTIMPIRDEASHKAALVEIDRLWGAAAGTAEGDRLDILMTLADAYERLRWPDEDMHPIDAIKARMENSGRTRRDFEKIAGSSGRASEILNRRRHLTLAMIWKLVRQWGIPADLLVKPYALARRLRGFRPARPRKKIAREIRSKRRAAANRSKV
jgi:HTH-type transcriptional regulator/antitoxin HigA